MAIKRFVEAAGKKSGYGYVGPDRIPGTSKIRTFVTGSWLYSKESDLKKIISKQTKSKNSP